MGQTERLAQPQSFGKYQLIARLSHGRMGDVFKAKSHGVEGFEKILVVKVVHPALAQNQAFVERLIEEAKRSVSLSHANVVQVYDLGQEDGGQFYIATEYVNGFDLRRATQIGRMADRPRPMELSVFIASEVAKGLDYAHRRKDYNFNNLNIIHRNLSPSNIMLSLDGEVKVTDFGTSRALDVVEPLDDAEESRRFLYAAPEVARGEPATQKSDIFSLGLVFYEMLAGVHPYEDPDPSVVRQNAAQARIAPINQHVDVPRPLMKILESMLVPDPAGRANSAGGLYEDLVAYIFGNNIRADTRALAQMVQELRREEQRMTPEETTQEVGLEEISLSDLRILSEHSDPSIESNVPDVTNAELPSHKLESLLMGDERPPLPGALEEYFASARSGSGKAVLVSGQMGSGHAFLPDRLVDALGWRGSTRAVAVQTSPDDSYVPFGTVAEFILRALDVRDDHAAGLEALKRLELEEEAVQTVASLWNLESPPRRGAEEKKRLLTKAFFAVLEEATRRGPLVLVIDRIERVDDVSMHVLREVVTHIGKMSLMLVMCTSNAELMRAAFDVGNPQDLEAVHVAGGEPPELGELTGLEPVSAQVLALAAMSGRAMTQSDLSQITGLPGDQLIRAIRELTERGVMRVPAPGTFIAAPPDLMIWVEERFTRTEIEQKASQLARYYTHRVMQSDVGRLTPALVRLYAFAGDRRQMLREAHRYAHWLDGEGWIDTLLDFYQHAASLIATQSLGAPQARIGFLLRRAELALELSRIDVCRATLEPISALTEALRNERGAIRGQLLLGQMAMQQDDLVDALKHFRRATAAARSINDPDLLAFSLLSLARWHDRYGDPLAGQRMLDGAMNLYNRWGTYRMDLATRALMLNRAVRLFAERGLLTRAERIEHDLRRLAETSGLALVACRADWAEATLHLARRDFAAARATLHRAVERASAYGLTTLRIDLMREAAAVALDAGEHAEVIELTDALVRLADEHQDLYSAQRALDLRATACCHLGSEVAASLEHLMASLRRAQDREVPKDIYRCHVNLEGALRAVGRIADAEQHFAYAREIARRLRYHAAA